MTTIDHGMADEDEGPSDLEAAIAWARTPSDVPVHEDGLPQALVSALAEVRAQAPAEGEVRVLAWRSMTDGVDSGHAGPAGPLPADDELSAISVVTSEVTASRTHVVGHVAVLHRLDRQHRP